MTNEVKSLLHTWFESYINRFRDANGILPPALELKYFHSLRVAENARIIAEGFGLSAAEISLAHGCGLLHDIGRFTQFVNYGSFRDANTVDHGVEGLRVLAAEGLRPLLSKDDWPPIACAVEYHNKKAANLPDKLSRAEELFLRLIRDADKLDIMDLVLQSVAKDGFRELPDMLPHIRLNGGVTAEVMDEVTKTQSVSIDRLSTLADFLVMLASWFYDFNYPPTMRLADELNIINRIQRELPDTKAVRELLSGIKNNV
jgi:hypothetical protein